MKESKKRIDLFFVASEKYLQMNNGKENKLLYALRKVRKILKNDNENYIDDIQEIRIDLASVDDKGNLMIKDNQYEFKPEKLKEFNKRVKQKGLEEIEFEPYYASDIPEDLPFAFKELFTNFVIKSEEI